MNLSDIKNLISEVGKVVFVENDKVVGVFLSYEEYRKIAAQKGEQCSCSNLPLFTPKEAPAKPAVPASPIPASPMVMEDAFEDELVEILPEEPEVKPAEIKQEKELTLDDLPF